MKYILGLLFLSLLNNGFTQGSGSFGHVQISIRDSVTTQPTAARARLTRNGNVVNALPREAVAVMYGRNDNAEGYGFQPDSSFYVDGSFQLELPPGKYSLFLSKGLEYRDQYRTFEVSEGKSITKVYNMSRWIDMPSRGWYSADDHIHVRRSPREDSLLMTWLKAEDVHVGVMLKMGDFWATYFQQYAFGEKGVYQEGNTMIVSGQEDPRTPELGHTLGIGASDFVRYRDEYFYYDNVFDQLHKLQGVTAYAHQAESFHGYRGLMMDGLRGKVDALELLQFCVSQEPLQTKHYYHLLDLGYAVTAIAGSDFPWCGKEHDSTPGRNARIGNARFYTKLDSPLTFQKWKHSVRQGHTFVTSGPMIDLLVNDAIPGDTLHVKKGAKIKIAVKAFGDPAQVPLRLLEIVKHGKAIASVKPSDKDLLTPSYLWLNMTVKADEGFWIAARSYGDKGQSAHTTPVYVSVDNDTFHNRKTAEDYLTLAEQYLRELENELLKRSDNPEYQSWRYRKGLEQRIAEVRKVIWQLDSKLR